MIAKGSGTGLASFEGGMLAQATGRVTVKMQYGIVGNIRQFQALGLLAVSMAVSHPAFAQERALRPSGEWAFSEDEESCTMQRTYSADAEGDTTLYIRSWGPSAPARVSVVGPTALRDDSAAVAADIGLDDEDIAPTAAIASSSGGQPMVYFLAMLPPVPPYGAQGGTGILVDFGSNLRPWIGLSYDNTRLTLGLPDRGRQSFELGALGEALNSLSACEQQLVAKWSEKLPPTGNLSRVPQLANVREVHWAFYRPDSMIINRRSWITHYRLEIDETGRMADCVVQSPKFGSKINKATCDRIEKVARFEPAQDRDGKAVSAIYNGSYMFVQEN